MERLFCNFSKKCIWTEFDKKNHSGEHGLRDWDIFPETGHDDDWMVECGADGVPSLPQAPEFENKQHNFAVYYKFTWKSCIIDLENEGISAKILDNLQPPIEVHIWLIT